MGAAQTKVGEKIIWRSITPARAASLEAELRRELTAGHLLYGRSAQALAWRRDSDDVLFGLGDTGEIALVHLTWSSDTESPPFPSTDIYPSFEVCKAHGGASYHWEFIAIP